MEQNSSRVVSTNNDPQKAASGLKLFYIFSLICLALGILAAWAGIYLIDSLSPWAKDSEEFAAFLSLGAGIALIMLSIALPVAMRASRKNMAAKHHMSVYDDHIEGCGIRLIGNTQTLSNFYEKFDRISSVSMEKLFVVVIMKDGSSVRCMACNAEQVAAAIRARLC